MQPAFGLYTHIRANAFRSVLLIAGMFALIYALTFGYCLILTAVFDNGPFGYIVYESARSVRIMSPYITAGAMMWILLGYTFNKSIISAMARSKPVTRQQEPELYNLLENLCISRGMAMPTLAIIDTPELNAFASGLTKDQYTVTVTTGLLEHLDDDEIEAVLAHELTHIRNQDVRLMVIAVVIVGMIAMAIEMMLRWVFVSSGNRNNGRGGNGALPAILLGIAIIAGVWFLSQLMNFALSRRREYMADAGAVELTKNPDAMISALRKIEGCSDIENMPAGMMEMCIDNPRTDFASWFATHPSIDDRVAALKKFAGGEEPHSSERPTRSRIADRLAQAGRTARAGDNPWASTAEAGPTPADGGRPAPNPWSVEDVILVGGAIESAQQQQRAAERQQETRERSAGPSTADAPAQSALPARPGQLGFGPSQPRRRQPSPQADNAFSPEPAPVVRDNPWGNATLEVQQQATEARPRQMATPAGGANSERPPTAQPAPASRPTRPRPALNRAAAGGFGRCAPATFGRRNAKLKA